MNKAKPQIYIKGNIESSLIVHDSILQNLTILPKYNRKIQGNLLIQAGSHTETFGPENILP
jgi:hypothetical protein